MKAVRVATGIYKDEKGKLYERPFINGRRTWRRLKSLTLTDAKVELGAKRSDHHRSRIGLARDPYKATVKLSQIFDQYEAAGLPDRRGRPWTGKSLYDERFRLGKLRPFWSGRSPLDVNFATAQAYGNDRGAPRSADLELYTLSNALTFAVRGGLIPSNPIAHDSPRFHRAADVQHCREIAPASGDELHLLAAKLFERPQTEALGWQLLFEAFTGCRTSEILDLRMHAKDNSTPGFIKEDWLWLKRRKNGTNPFALIHPALRDAIQAHREWHARRFPNHPMWIPHRFNRAKSADVGALPQALRRICPILGLPKRTSHGLRALFVTVRRSQGASDAQIAAEIGDATGATLIASTYGAVPSNWQGGSDLQFQLLKHTPHPTI